MSSKSVALRVVLVQTWYEPVFDSTVTPLGASPVFQEMWA